MSDIQIETGVPMAIKIDKNIPMPNSGKKNVERSKYPFSRMKVGDSFFAPCKMWTISASVGKYNKALAPKRFSARSIDGGVRVWRVK